MDYLLKANGIVLMLFFFYYVFLKNETFFKSIRSYFIIGLLIILAIPLIEIPIYVEAVSSQLNLLDYKEITSTSIAKQTIDWTQIFVFIYLIGVVFFSIKFLFQLISLGNLISKHQLTKQGKYYFAETSKNISPFSFFNIIIYNKSQFSINELEHIINHEKAHAQQWHSIDTLLVHLLVITLWFNPFVWLYKKAVQQNLEFLADAKALEQASNLKLYQLTLLKTSGANYCTEITNNFYNSLLKKRIIMLHKNKSKNLNQWKYTLLLPILIAFVFTFNTKSVAQEKKLIEIEGISNVKITLSINKNTSNEEIKKEAAFFKKELAINLTFKGIKRNANDEIIAIKIEARGKGIKSKFENASSTPINPISISYDQESNNFTIGNIVEKDKMGIHEIHKLANTFYADVNNGKDNHYTFTTTYSDDNISTKIDSLNTLEVKEITINGKKEKIWIKKKGKTANIDDKLNEIHFELSDDENHEIKIISEDNASENIFIIKTDEDKFSKHNISKKENFIFISSENEEPLYIIDGKETSSEKMKKIKPDSIEKIEVLKGESATKKYGKKGENGVIIITTKKE